MYIELQKDIFILLRFSTYCAIINPQWLKVPISRTNFHGLRDVQAIEVRLNFYLFQLV